MVNTDVCNTKKQIRETACEMGHFIKRCDTMFAEYFHSKALPRTSYSRNDGYHDPIVIIDR